MVRFGMPEAMTAEAMATMVRVRVNIVEVGVSKEVSADRETARPTYTIAEMEVDDINTGFRGRSMYFTAQDEIGRDPHGNSMCYCTCTPQGRWRPMEAVKRQGSAWGAVIR
jgi:hypothetical protein